MRYQSGFSLVRAGAARRPALGIASIVFKVSQMICISLPRCCTGHVLRSDLAPSAITIPQQRVRSSRYLATVEPGKNFAASRIARFALTDQQLRLPRADDRRPPTGTAWVNPMRLHQGEVPSP